MSHITPARSLELAAKAWRRGVKMRVIIVDGWSRGFNKEQTLHECIQAGYSAVIADPAINQRWAQIDAEVAKAEKACGSSIDWEIEASQIDEEPAKQLAADRRERIARYEAYWDKEPARLHHLINCPNVCCDQQLKIARPAKGSGEMWDSLATCPYCNGTFFYESRHLSIKTAFKGFL